MAAEQDPGAIFTSISKREAAICPGSIGMSLSPDLPQLGEPGSSFSPCFPTVFCHCPVLGPGEGLGQIRGSGEVPAGAQPAHPAPAVPP